MHLLLVFSLGSLAPEEMNSVTFGDVWPLGVTDCPLTNGGTEAKLETFDSPLSH